MANATRLKSFSAPALGREQNEKRVQKYARQTISLLRVFFYVQVLSLKRKLAPRDRGCWRVLLKTT
jgi:hypothetical protein